MVSVHYCIYLFVRGKIPAYLGSSFAFIAPVAGVLSAGLGYEGCKGAFVVFGLSFVILSILVRYIGTRWIDKVIPSSSDGGYRSYYRFGISASSNEYVWPYWQSRFRHEPQPSYFYLYVFLSCYLAWYCCVPWLLSCNPCFYWRCFRLYLVCLHGVVDFSAVEAAPWFSLPQFYGMPVFDINAIIMIMPALFVVFAEHVGHLVVTSNIVSKT